jgi:hypothetical protein
MFAPLPQQKNAAPLRERRFLQAQSETVAYFAAVLR